MSGKINIPYGKIAAIKVKLRTDTIEVVTYTETKSGDDIFGVSDVLTSGIVALQDCQFYWEDNINSRWSEGGRVDEGKAIAVISFEDKSKISGDNKVIKKDGFTLRINRTQEFPDTKEIILNLEKIV